MDSFLKYYWSNVLQRWSIFLVTIPGWPAVAAEVNSFWLQSNTVDQILTIITDYVSWWWSLVILVILHLTALHKLYTQEKATPASALVTVSDEYQSILSSVESIYPDSFNEIEKKIREGSKALQQESLSIPVGISSHFVAHNAIYTLLQQSIKARDARITFATEIDSVISAYEVNLGRLRTYNNDLGNNKSLPSEHELRQTVTNTNANALSLFGFYEPS